MQSRSTFLFGVLLALSSTAIAQAQPAPASSVADRRYGPAPWWARDPIIASVGRVEVITPANRAGFSASFQSVQRELPAATREAAAKVRALGQALAAYGADKVQVQITFSTRPLYEQYRDRTGTVQENQRSDQIERYQVDAQVTVLVRDISVLERVYATVLAAGPVATNPVSFSLLPTNEMRSDMAQRAVVDATRRARQAAEATGGHLGAVRLIDPTGRACETDVLVAGAPRSGPDNEYATVEMRDGMMSRMSPVSMAPPPPPPSDQGGSSLSPEQMQVPLTPPLQSLQDSACVIFGLAP